MIAAVVLAATTSGAWWSIAAVRAAPIDSFVTRAGAQLVVDGHPYRFGGFDIYNANSDDWCNYHYTDTELASAFHRIGPGAADPNTYPQDGAVVRSWFFQSLAATKTQGSTHRFAGARDWTRFDRTLADARAAGVRVIVTLTDEWGECGDNGAGGRKTDAWYRGGYLSADPAELSSADPGRGYDHWVSYHDWVQEVVSRYAGNSEILAWQLINEGEAARADGSCPSDANAIMRGWATDISALIRSLDPAHLISLGTIGSGQCGAGSTAEFTALHALPDIDLCEFHDYGAPNDAIPGDIYNGLQTRLDACAALGKPLFVGELGIRPSEAGPTLAAGDGFTCAMRGDVTGSASCWGDPALTLPQANFDAIAVTAAGGHACRLRPDLTVACWGANDAGQSDPPPGLAGVTMVSASERHACALRNDTTAVCWGANDAGQSTVPPGLAGLRAVAAGSNFSCAIQDGTVVCWGANDAGQATPPPGLASVVTLALGTRYGCALRDNGTVACWGADDAGQATPPPGLAQVATISAGPRHVCVLHRDGTPACWGDDGHGEASPPAETMLGSIAAGTDHTCAVKSGSTVRCWGANGAGQSTAPTSLFVTLLDRRADAFQAKLVAMENAGVAGVLVWHYSERHTAPTLDGFDIGPGEHELLLLAKSRVVAPGAPADVQAQPADGSVCLTWSPPSFDGGAPISGYVIEVNPGGPTLRLGSGDNICLGGLSNGATYTARIAAVNNGSNEIAHTGPWSAASNAFVPGMPPGPPTAVVAAAGDGVASVSWLPPVNVDPGNPISGYTVYILGYAPSPAPHATPSYSLPSITVDGSTTTTTVSGLTNGRAYAFQVAARNLNGTGDASGLSAAVTPLAGATLPQTTVVAIPPSGGTATTDPLGAGPTTANPVTTGVEVPGGVGGGTLSIAESSTLDPAPVGYAFAGQQITISSTAATSATAPLRIVFRLDPSLVPVVVFRNGVPIDTACTIAGFADPTPCLESGMSTAQITILSAAASTWNVGIRAYAFSGFLPPIANLPAVNAATGGSSIPVKFGLGGNRGLNVFAPGYPKSQAIACDASRAVDGVDRVLSQGPPTVTIGPDGRYQFTWKTVKGWTGCRVLVLRFRDGSVQRALFKFK